jgi:hypothetical protein
MNRAMLPNYRKAASLAAGLFVLLVTAACSNSLFKVKPVSEIPPMPASAASMNVGSITFRAAPLLNDEQTQELFESNLQLAGLLPVRLEMVHNGGEAIEIKKLRLRLHDAAGTEWKLVSAKKAISRIMDANGIRLYNPNSRKTFEKEFRAYEFDLKTAFANPEKRRQGLIIFQSPQKQPVATPRGLVLSVEGLAQPVSLNLQ